MTEHAHSPEEAEALSTAEAVASGNFTRCPGQVVGKTAWTAVIMAMSLASLTIIAIVVLSIARYNEREDTGQVIDTLTDQIDQLETVISGQADQLERLEGRLTQSEIRRECLASEAVEAEAAELELVIAIAETFGGVLETGTRDVAALRERADDARRALEARRDILDC